MSSGYSTVEPFSLHMRAGLERFLESHHSSQNPELFSASSSNGINLDLIHFRSPKNYGFDSNDDLNVTQLNLFYETLLLDTVFLK